jgi:hypothetical protein
MTSRATESATLPDQICLIMASVNHWATPAPFAEVTFRSTGAWAVRVARVEKIRNVHGHVGRKKLHER